jgi:WD40 repeat protein
VNYITFSADEMMIASAADGDDYKIRIWNVTTFAQISSLEGHSAPVTRFVFSSDNKRLISVGDDESIKIWHVESGRLIKTFTADQSQKDKNRAINTLYVSSDDEFFWVGYKDGSYQKWAL